MHHIETLNKFLKEELSATETYQQALDHLKNDAKLDESIQLMPIYEDHKTAVANLQELIHQLGGVPIDTSGLWGTWAKMVLGGANILGKQSTLKALQEGEKNGTKDFEEALEDKELPLDIRALIETKLLPGQQEHIRILEQLLEEATA